MADFCVLMENKMKKPQLYELTLREKIGQMLAPHHWEVYGKTESEYDYKPVNIDELYETLKNKK